MQPFFLSSPVRNYACYSIPIARTARNINDLTENVASGVKLFADDTSLFSVVQNENETALSLNNDLENLRIWEWQWKMKFNADKTEEVVFSCKRNKPAHPSLKLGSSDIIAKTEHKHLGVILDSKLDFQSHVIEAIVNPITTGGGTKCPRRRLFDAVLSVGEIQT